MSPVKPLTGSSSEFFRSAVTQFHCCRELGGRARSWEKLPPAVRPINDALDPARASRRAIAASGFAESRSRRERVVLTAPCSFTPGRSVEGPTDIETGKTAPDANWPPSGHGGRTFR